MTHTHDTLMALADTWAKGYSLHSKEGDEARAALSAALQEVLAERDALAKAAYLAGFNASGEGYNGEYPFDQKGNNPVDDPVWVRDRDNALAAMKGTPT